MKEDIVLMLLQIQNQFKILHWQTLSYSRHSAYGKIYDSLSDNIDEFVEICMGKQGRFEFNGEKSTIELFNLKALDINSFITTVTDFLIGLSKELSPDEDTDLLNIRDEILGAINKLKYLLSLK
jgi:hypothetical protein